MTSNIPTERFNAALERSRLAPLTREGARTLQLNLGKRCNQTCLHCHVDAGPNRKEEMSLELIEQAIALLERSPELTTVDLTGGAPEMNPHFRRIVEAARGLGREVIDRCNLTILVEPGYEWLAPFLAENGVRVVASLPCYGPENVDAQRGNGVFDKSVAGLRLLNGLGYGVEGSGLTLDLVYNPGGAFLPPAQAPLEEAYRQRLRDDLDLTFTSLLTLTNLPIARFRGDLQRSGKLEGYMELLDAEFNPCTVNALMCRDHISVAWDGQLYDCDFNQMLKMPIRNGDRSVTLDDLVTSDSLTGRRILVGDHCLGCTAGAGSSCGGALV